MNTCKTAKMSPFDQVLPDGSWLDHLDPSYLAKTYPSWASDVSTVEEAAGAFRRQGFLELAALADGLHFDPAYYAEANPAWEGASDLERYRSWLIEGIPVGRPGSPVAHLRKLGLSLEFILRHSPGNTMPISGRMPGRIDGRHSRTSARPGSSC